MYPLALLRSIVILPSPIRKRKIKVEATIYLLHFEIRIFTRFTPYGVPASIGEQFWTQKVDVGVNTDQL